MRSLAPLLLAALLAGCGASQLPPTPAPPPSPTAAPTATPPRPEDLAAGIQVDIGAGRAIFLRCAGTAGQGPTVLLEAGLGAGSASWQAVQAEAARLAYTCSYDRAGLGQSSPGPTPRTAELAAADLAAALAAAGVPGPYLLVAHSFGALFALSFTAAYPDDVIGLALADPVSPDYWDRARALLPPPDPAEGERLAGFRQFVEQDWADPGRNQEQLDLPAIAAAARAADLADRPLVILVAGIPDVIAPGLPADFAADLQNLLQQELPRELADRSSDSTVVGVPDSGHNIPQQRPDMILLSIQALLAATAAP